jgi:hypothetical protein
MEATTIEAPKVHDYDRDFRGYVLGIDERNGYSDSDFFATVWDEEQGCVRTISDGTTRFAAPPKYAGADASSEVWAKAEAWWAANVGPKQALETILARRKFIDVGSEVEVAKGRKIPKGTKGEVFWKGKDQFYRSYGYGDTMFGLPARAFRIGIRLLDGSRVYTSMDNVFKLNVLPPTEAEIAEWVKNHNPYKLGTKR